MGTTVIKSLFAYEFFFPNSPRGTWNHDTTSALRMLNSPDPSFWKNGYTAL